MVRVAGCAGVEEMAGAPGSPRRVPMETPQCSPEAASSPTGSDYPSLCPGHEPSSPVRNRMREICTSGTVRGEGGDILTYSARERRQDPQANPELRGDGRGRARQPPVGRASPPG